MGSLLELCKCDECPLNGAKKVPGEGSEDYTERWEEVDDKGTKKRIKVRDYHPQESYDIVMVGIAPAEVETREGSPFRGWSGTLLRQTLEKMGVSVFYLTNSMLCQLLEDLKDSERDLAVKCCKDRLFEEVRSKHPKLIIALGNVPLEALTGVDYKIRSVNGRVLPGIIAPVLPVIHPASLARRADEFYDFVDGLRSAPKYLSGTYQQAAIPSRTIVDAENIGEVLREIDKRDLIAVDLETTKNGFFPYGRDPDKIRCMVVAVNERVVYIFPGESSPYFEPHPNFIPDERLKDILKRKKLLTHNGPFDIGFLLQAGYKGLKIFFDTFLGHYCMDERQYSHGLKALASKYNGAPDWEADIKNFLPHKASSYDLIPDENLYEYAAWDGTQTYQLSEGAGFRKKVSNTFPYKNILGPCMNMFAEIRHRGIPVDVGLLMELDGILEKELNEELEELEKLSGIYFSPFSPQDTAEVLYDKLGYKEVKGYGRSTAARVLDLIGSPVCAKIKEIREFGKLKSTYVVGLSNFIDKEFRIHPFTKLHAAVTGRISATDPSMMNVHKKGGVRRLYLPEDGRLILEADQKQMELRCLALVSGDEHLLDIIRKFDRGEGPDPHQLVNDELDRRTGKEWERDKAKAGVFGRAYGRGEEDFMESYGLSYKDVSDLLNIIDGFLPGLKDYNTRVKKDVHKTGILTSFFGRKRRFGLILDSNKHDCYRQGANFYPQSMGSDLNLLSMLHLWSMKDKLGIYPLFPVHDSIVIDIPDRSVVPEIKKEMEEYCEELVNGELTFKVDCAVGKSWGDAKKVKP